MRIARLYSPAIVCLVWAGTVALLGNGVVPTVFFLLAMAGAIRLHVAAERETYGRARRPR